MKPKLIRITTVPISLKVLLKGQLRFMNQYFDVVGVSSRGKELVDVGKDEGIRTVALDMSREITPVKDLVSLVKMIVLLRKEKPDIVHTHTPKAGLIGMLGARITGVPHRLHTVAGLPLMESTGVKRKILMLVEWLTYKCSTHIYPNSFGLEEFILKSGLATKDKVKVLGNGSSNGIDTEYFRKSDELLEAGERIREQYGIDSEDFIFIFVGRIVKDKGINELLQAFDNISKKEARFKLLLVGSFEEELDPIAENSKKILHENRQIIVTGFQNDIRPFLLISDVLVFPSHREGFPNVVLQAGAMGLPAIVSNINGCNEIIKDNKNGLIIPVKDADAVYNSMQKIYEDSKLRNTMKENARKMIVERYSQKLIWQALKSEYDQLLKMGIK
jgi:glycosyltransferase involved in cell wall biosynthesis